MVRKVIILFSLLMSVCSLSFAASLQSLDQKGATNALQDKTITTIPLATLKDRLIMTRVSIYFGADGKVVGKFARKPDNYPQSDMGTWKVQHDGQVCVNWPHWNDGKDMCVYVYNMKNSLVFANPNGYFDSLVLDRFIKSGNHVEEIKSFKEMHEMRHEKMMMKEKAMGSQPQAQPAAAPAQKPAGQ